MIFTSYWKVLVVKFLEIVKTVFFEPKSDRKIIFTDNGKVFVLNFSEMENSVFLWTKKGIETLYLLSLLSFPGLGKYGVDLVPRIPSDMSLACRFYKNRPFCSSCHKYRAVIPAKLKFFEVEDFQLSDMRYDDRNVVTKRVTTTAPQIYLIWAPEKILEHVVEWQRQK